MNNLKLISWSSLSIALVATLIGYLEVFTALMVIFPPVLILILTLLGEIRRWAWVPTLSFCLILLFGAILILFDGPFLWTLLVVFGGLIFWDLSDFRDRLSTSEVIRKEPELVRIHLLRLALALSLAGAMIFLSHTITLELGFGISLLLLLILGIGQHRLIRLFSNRIG